MVVDALDGVVELTFDPVESNVMIVKTLMDRAEPLSHLVLKGLKRVGDHGGKLVEPGRQLIEPACKFIEPRRQLIDCDRNMIEAG